MSRGYLITHHSFLFIFIPHSVFVKQWRSRLLRWRILLHMHEIKKRKNIVLHKLSSTIIEHRRYVVGLTVITSLFMFLYMLQDPKSKSLIGNNDFRAPKHEKFGCLTHFWRVWLYHLPLARSSILRRVRSDTVHAFINNVP